MLTITADVLTRMAKSVSGEMRHTQKLDAFAKVLGYPDQTALMGDLKKRAAAQQASVVPDPSALSENRSGNALDKKIRELFKAHFDAIKGTDADLYDASEWRVDIDRGDTKQGFDAWREGILDGLLEEVGIWGLLRDYARFDFVSGAVTSGPAGQNRFTYRADTVLDVWKFAGAEEALGEEVVEMMEKVRFEAAQTRQEPDDIRNQTVAAIIDLINAGIWKSAKRPLLPRCDFYLG